MKTIAYLVSDYDAPSHTFIRREIAALRELGAVVAAFSVQKPNSADSEAQSLLGRSPLAYLSAASAMLARRPARFWRTWLTALRHRPPGLRNLVWSQFHFVEAVLLARLLQRAQCHHLHSHFANSGATVGMLAAELLGIRWSLTLHGISETDYPAGMLLAEKVRRADFVACASYFMRAQAMRMVEPAHWAKMSIVRCGIDLARLPEPEQRFGEEDGLNIICVGRLSPEKGYFGLLEALDHLKRRGMVFHLTVVGDGPAASAILNRVSQLCLDDRIEFAGFRREADTLGLIARSDVFVLPSLMEGLPVVLMEALALGKPALASRVAGIPELIVEEKTGLMFTPSDWPDLAEKLERLLTDEPLRRRLAVEGRCMIEAEFQIQDAASRLHTLFLRDKR